ncbi:modification methylase [Paenibacillus sp. JMULE4]|uniref:DNA methyltransferase n=1 Tax=Paenibacillus sp. JMULE4 TaxID=2518342 RepID=UPI001575872B|nr:DNA methyltransferase [Paenibacillus sp. JMULE4]NTZ20676.1 modification methylase [Paenibacillus sp. JMULE4]
MSVRTLNIEDIQNESFYENFERPFNVINGNLQSATYRALVNFTGSVNYPRHRWFYYREGFSPELVQALLDEFNVPQEGFICDPFSGAGTTLSVAHERNIRSVGFEVNPFSSFVSLVKTRNYTEEELVLLEEISIKLSNYKKDIYKFTPPENEYLSKIFDEDILLNLLMFKDFINQISNKKVRDLFFLAWLNSLEPVAKYRKAGNGLKIKTKIHEQQLFDSRELILNQIQNTLKLMKEDLKNTRTFGFEPDVYEESAMELNKFILPNQLDAAIFSPPYANCFDYTKIYYMELWMGDFVRDRDDQKEVRMKSVRSHVHATWPSRHENYYLPELHDMLLPAVKSQKLWTNRIPDMLKGYFEDMNVVLTNLYEALRPGGSCAIVVSNSAYGGIIIPTDTILAASAKNIGFDVKEIEVERLIITSSQQYK